MSNKRAFTSDDTSLIRLIERSLKTNWDQPAYSDYGTDRCYTYKDVAERIERLHYTFKNLGIRPGDKIALCGKSCCNWSASLFAILTYGAVAVPILADFHVDQIEHIFEHSGSKLLICTKRLADASSVIPADKMMDMADFSPFRKEGGVGDGGGVIASALAKADSTFLGVYPDGMRPENVSYFVEDPDALALISYTSGSTGFSKGVMLPYKSIWSNVLFADEKLAVPNRSRLLSLLPLAHMYGFAFEFMYAFCIGCHVSFLAKAPSPNVLVKAFADIKPDLLVVVPLIIEKIVQNKVFPLLRLKRVKIMMGIPLLRRQLYRQICKRMMKSLGGKLYEVVIGGAALNSDVEAFLKKIHFPYTVGYGMTECGPIIAYEDWKTFAQGSCGKCVPRMEVRIDSDDPMTEPGEIVCRGTNVMIGYYNNPEATKEVIDKDGWLHTGDLATLDKHGNIFIRGRQKNLLLGANGQNVYPEEIESKICAHTVFDECVVVQRDNQLVALVYVSEPTLEGYGMTLEDVRTHLSEYRSKLNEMLPPFARLSSLEMVDEEFEKTPKRNIKRFLYK